MFEGIRRLVRRPAEGTDWDKDPPMEIEAGAGSESKAVLLAGEPEPAPMAFHSAVVPAGREYYAGLARAAIAGGGRSGDYAISVYWLRMMLAGLEGGDVSSRAVWEGKDLWGSPLP